MIRLHKSLIPQVLEQNASEWTNVLLAHKLARTTPSEAEKSRYRHAAIKAALLAETNGKCAYCESKLRHVTFGDVEHIIPKSVVLEKTFEWSNLTLACVVCNTHKGSHFGDHEDLVDPYVVDPGDHLNFVGAVVLPKPGSGSGMATESTIKLNRPELVERRMEKLLSINKLLHLLVEVADDNKKAIIRRDLEIAEQTPDREYAAMTRTFLAQQLPLIDQSTQAGN